VVVQVWKTLYSSCTDLENVVKGWETLGNVVVQWLHRVVNAGNAETLGTLETLENVVRWLYRVASRCTLLYSVAQRCTVVAHGRTTMYSGVQWFCSVRKRCTVIVQGWKTLYSGRTGLENKEQWLYRVGKRCTVVVQGWPEMYSGCTGLENAV
jgi:hypothetical protein